MITKAVSQFKGSAAVERVCWCGIHFAVPKELGEYYVRANDRNPGSFSLYCPLGHGMVPANPDHEKQRLRDDLARERARLDQAKAEVERMQFRIACRDRQISARKAVATKLRKRIAKGTCPCCHAQFKDLKQHMQAQHPKWDPEMAAAAIAAKTTSEVTA